MRQFRFCFLLLGLFLIPCAHADLKKSYGHLKNKNYALALKEALPEAKAGQPAAAELVGWIYMSAESGLQDHAAAYKYLLVAAKAGRPSAQSNLGVLLKNGQGTPRNLPEAFRNFEQAADQGNVIAQHEAGAMLLQGLGVDKDQARGVELMNRSASAGYTLSELFLGMLIARGLLPDEEPMRAVELLMNASSKGNPTAMYELGWFYLKGEKFFRSVDQALFYLEKAYSKDYPPASLLLMHLYTGGMGVPVNLSKAASLASEIYSSKNFPSSPAARALPRGWIGSPTEDELREKSLLVKKLKSLADEGDALSIHNLALLHFEGTLGVPLDRKAAVDLLRRAVELGRPESMVVMASWHLSMVDELDPHPFEAFPLLEEAALKHDNAQAFFELGRLYLDGHVVEKDEIKGQEYIRKAALKAHFPAIKLSAALIANQSKP